MNHYNKLPVILGFLLLSGYQALAAPISCERAVKEEALDAAFQDSDDQFRCRIEASRLVKPWIYEVRVECDNATYDYQIATYVKSHVCVAAGAVRIP